MNCHDCKQEISGKPIKYTKIVGTLADEMLLCTTCAEGYNLYKNHDGKDRSHCMKCTGKFLTEELTEVTIKKEKVFVCGFCKEELGK